MRAHGTRSRALIAALLLVLSGLSQTPGSAQQREREPAASQDSAGAALQAALAAFVERTGVPGVTLAVDFGDGRTLQCAAGFADREAKRPMRPGDRMLSGSTGKTFVSAVALALHTEEVLSLDDPMQAWLDEAWLERLPNAGLEITLRQLLDHTSGLPEYYLQPEFRPVLADAPTAKRTPTDCLAFIFDKPAHFAPGEGYSYADSNYLLAGLVIEAAAKKPFYTLTRERFLEPLGLEDTFPSDRHELPELTPGYTSTTNYFGLPQKLYSEGRHHLDPSFEWCGGGFLSNAPDLARWTRLFASGQALDADYLSNLLLGHPARIGIAHEYGLGLMIFDSDHGPVRGHTGFFPGYLTAMGYFVDHDLAIAFQTNCDETMRLGRYITHELVDFAGVVLENDAPSKR